MLTGPVDQPQPECLRIERDRAIQIRHVDRCVSTIDHRTSVPDQSARHGLMQRIASHGL